MSEDRQISSEEMYCSKCGAIIKKIAEICPKCGCRVATTPIQNANSEQDKPNFGFAFLGFCIPLIGLILYLVWRDKTPLKAKSCGKGALIGFIVSVVCFGIFTCVEVLEQL